MQSSLLFGLVETGSCPRGSCLQCTVGSATPWENEERSLVLCSAGDDQLLPAILLSWVEVSNTSPPAASRSFHGGHLYSVCVNVVGCLVLWKMHSVTAFFHVLIRLLQNLIQNESCLLAWMSARCLCTEVWSCAGSVGDDPCSTAQQCIY